MNSEPKDQPGYSPRKKSFIWGLRLATAAILSGAVTYACLYYFSAPKARPFSELTAAELYSEGKSLRLQNDLKKSHQYLEKCLTLSPFHYRAAIEMGNIYHTWGEFIKAAEYARQAIHYASDDIDNRAIAYMNLGLALSHENKITESWEAFRESLRLNPKFIHESFNSTPANPDLALQAVMDGNNQGFASILEKDKNTFPPQVSKRGVKLEQWETLRQHKKILRECSEYISRNPGSRFNYYFQQYQAYAYAELHDFESSFKIIKELETLPLPENAKIWNKERLYHNLIINENYDEALLLVQEIAKEHPQKYTGLYKRYLESLIYNYKKDFVNEKRALEDILQSTDRENYSSYAHERLIEINSFQKDYPEAIQHLVKFYTPQTLWITLAGILLGSLGFIGFLFVFSRIFFLKRAAQIASQNFRLKHLLGAELASSYANFFFMFLPILLLKVVPSMADPMLLSTIFGDFVLIFIVFYFLTRKHRMPWKEAGFLKHSYKKPFNHNRNYFNRDIHGMYSLGKGLGGFIQQKIPTTIVGDIVNGYLTLGTLYQKAFVFVSVVAIGPLAEEIYYRIFMFRIIEAYTGTRTSVVLTSLIFASTHCSLPLFPYYFVIGATLSVAYLKTKSIYPALLAHVITNLIYFLIPS